MWECSKGNDLLMNVVVLDNDFVLTEVLSVFSCDPCFNLVKNKKLTETPINAYLDTKIG